MKVLFAVVAHILGFSRLAAALDEVKVHTSGSTSANVLIYKIAQER